MKREQEYAQNEGEFTRQEFFFCSCGAWQDHVVVEYDRSNFGKKDDPDYYDDLTFHVQMNHFLPWYKRLSRAILYVFAKDAKWHHWGETMLSKEDAIRMRNILTDYIESPYPGND